MRLQFYPMLDTLLLTCTGSHPPASNTCRLCCWPNCLLWQCLGSCPPLPSPPSPVPELPHWCVFVYGECFRLLLPH